MELPFGVYNTSFKQDLAVVRTKTQWIMLILVIAFAFFLPTVMPGEWLTWFIATGIFIVAALGLHVLIGLSGQFSMCHSALMAVGAYTAGVLAQSHGLPAWFTLPLAGIAAGIVGMAFAIPAVRITGFYLVMVTMAAQFVIIWVVGKIGWTGGTEGMKVDNLVIFGQKVGDVGFCWIVLAVVVVCTILVKNIQRTNAGRRLLAMRDNEVAAEVMGINLFRTKLLAFFIGCFFAGIAGWLWAYNFNFLNPQQFDFMMSMKYLGMLVVGGIGKHHRSHPGRDGHPVGREVDRLRQSCPVKHPAGRDGQEPGPFHGTHNLRSGGHRVHHAGAARYLWQGAEDQAVVQHASLLVLAAQAALPAGDWPTGKAHHSHAENHV